MDGAKYVVFSLLFNDTSVNDDNDDFELIYKLQIEMISHFLLLYESLILGRGNFI